MGIYNIPVDNDSILQAVVANDDDVANNLKKLKSSLKSPVVGVDIKYGRKGTKKRMLVFSSPTFCLLINFFDKVVPKAVKDFMGDRTICFVALNSSYMIGCEVVRLGHLAARVLKKPILEYRNLETLAGEAGVERRQPPKLVDKQEVATRCGVLFSQEEMEFVIQDAYYTCVVADRLLGSLGA